MKGRTRSAGAPLGVGPCLTENRAGYAQQTCRVTEPHSGWGPAWVPSLPLNPHFRSTPLTLSSSLPHNDPQTWPPLPLPPSPSMLPSTKEP